MRRINSFILGLLCGSLIFGTARVLANTDVLARLTTQLFFWNDEKIELEAYNINGYNYVRLRDVSNIFGVNIEYDEETRSVYLGETKTERIIDGTSYAREDYSQKANSNVFNEIYMKEAYNSIRQTINDIETIIKNTDENGYNSLYNYAHYVDGEFTFNNPGKTDEAMKSVVSMFSAYYAFSLGTEPDIKNLYEYPGYRICKVQINNNFADTKKATDNFIRDLEGLSDREKVERIAVFVSDSIVYGSKNKGNLKTVFSSSGEVNGECGLYAQSFLYLCQRAKTPCLTVKDKDHAWNEVYVDGKWRTTDISYYDIARTEDTLFPENYPRKPKDIAKTEFAKELLVPMSTK